VVGGLTGRTSLGLLFVDLFYLPAELRGQGIGGEVLKQAEEESRRRGLPHRHALHDQLPGARLLRQARLEGRG